ncbi:MAG: hypothetical protein ABMA14_06110 [Hyphomonadaceae bacterium]
MNIKLLAGVALSMLGMSGCASISNLGASGLAENIENNAATLNEAHTRAMTSIIAINVLRARDRWPTNYTTLSGIKSNPSTSINGSASFGPLGLGNAPMPFANSSASMSRNDSANAEYSVNPFSNNDKTQGLLKPIQPEMMESYWKAGWPRETLMWLFIDSVHFTGEAQPWFIDGDEFSAAPSATDVMNTKRYVDIIKRAKDGDLIFGELPAQTLDQRNCKPYDAAYLRDTLGGGSSDGGRSGGMSDTIRTVEGLTGRQMVLTDDPRTGGAGEAQVAADKFNRRLLLCDVAATEWGFIDARTGAAIAAVRTRSFDDMIYFLGETLRSSTEDRPTVAGNVILFQTYPDRADKAFAVRVEHAGRVYFIAPQAPMGETSGPKDVTGNVLSLLNQLYLLAQSDEFLRAPEPRR